MNKENGKSLLIAILIVSVIAAIGFTAYKIVKNIKGEKAIFSRVESAQAELTNYIVYGTHLNIEGKINELTQGTTDIDLILESTDGYKKEINLQYEEVEDGYKFYTSDLINTGINLEEFMKNKYYMFIKLEYGKKKQKYYSLENKTEYDQIEYYTITKNGQNNKIEIKFDKHERNDELINYMEISVKQSKLPKDVYDIVIDPGHGGSDTGAQYNGFDEADLTLKFAKQVKEKLENLGLKVKITRDGTESKENFGTRTVYDENGRVNIVGKSKAKYVISIHLNSIEKPNSESGVEVYAPSKINLNLAKAFADNIVKYAKTSYSTLEPSYKKYDGVYVRTYQESEIEQNRREAEEGGYKPYNVTTDTPYLYMLRETGGIATGAYVDGRNKSYGTNNFYNSNIGVEAYLLELGYINNSEDMKNILENEDGYVDRNCTNC